MKRRNIIALTVLAAVLLSLGFFATPLMQHARAFAWDIVVRSTAKIADIKGIDISDSALDTLAKTSMENIRLQAELSDYGRLKQQLGSPSFDSMQAIRAQIISRPVDTLTSSYIINKGIADGIPSGAPVLTQGSVLVGFTKELSEHSASVQALFHPSTSLTVETVPKDEEKVARGLLKSRYQTSLSMDTIPRDASISVGQNVVTTAKSDQIPYGMIIGTVATLISPENEAYQQATIDVPYNSGLLDAVTVLVAP